MVCLGPRSSRYGALAEPFFSHIINRLRQFHIFPEHPSTPPIIPIHPPFFLCLPSDSLFSPDRSSVGNKAVLVSRLDPGTTTVLKGNKPLCLRFHRQHRVVLYASEVTFIDFAVDKKKGWRELEVSP